MSARGTVAGLPWLNTPVLVSVPGLDHDLPSRVEDVRGGLVVIAAVSPSPHARVTDGEVLVLSWAAPPRGLLATSCVLEHQERLDPPRWVLRSVGVLTDLGEGGARVLLDPGLRVPATVHQALMVRLEFDLSERDSDRVRRAVVRRQVEARRGEDRT